MKEPAFDIVDLLLWRISGELREGEQKILEDWRNAAPENRKLMESLDNDEYFNAHWRRFNEIDPETSWKVLQARLAARGLPNEIKTRPLFRYVSLALSLLVMAGLILFYFHQRSPSPTTTQPTVPADPLTSVTVSYAGGPAIALDTKTNSSITMGNTTFRLQGDRLFVQFPIHTGIEFGGFSNETFNLTTPAGHKYEVTLPDNSKILMNARAEISVRAGYGLHRRYIQLKGEARFKVKPIMGMPFVVGIVSPGKMRPLFTEGEEVTVTDWGTIFDIRANPEDLSIRAILIEGKISVQRPHDAPKDIPPGMAYVLDQTGIVKVLPMAALPGAEAWQNDEFYFQNEPINNILNELSRWYGVTIISKDNLTDSLVITGPRKLPINFMLDQMKVADSFDYHQSHDTIYLSR